MTEKPSRRSFLRQTAAAAAAGMVSAGRPARGISLTPPGPAELKLGLVTYLLAAEWDIPTIIKNCTETKFEGVELRTTHKHGVELTLTAAERDEVRRRFADSPVTLASLGSIYEYHSTDPAEVRRNIEGTKQYAKLARDLGCNGIKVRPNGIQDRAGIPVDQTLQQIGEALHECGAAAKEHGVEIRVEVHGRETNRPVLMKKIMDHADSDNVFVCWNSGDGDLLDGGFESNFDLLQDKIRFVHMRDLYLETYPFRRLFERLIAMGYRGYCCAEIDASTDPLRVMRYYRGLFLALQNKL